VLHVRHLNALQEFFAEKVGQRTAVALQVFELNALGLDIAGRFRGNCSDFLSGVLFDNRFSAVSSFVCLSCG